MRKVRMKLGSADKGCKSHNVVLQQEGYDTHRSRPSLLWRSSALRAYSTLLRLLYLHRWSEVSAQRMCGTIVAHILVLGSTMRLSGESGGSFHILVPKPARSAAAIQSSSTSLVAEPPSSRCNSSFSASSTNSCSSSAALAFFANENLRYLCVAPQ